MNNKILEIFLLSLIISCCKSINTKSKKEKYEKCKKIVLYVAISLGLIAGVAVATQFAGFGVKGIVAKSFAAKIHSILGNLSAGSLFANMQKFGMLGLLSKVKIIGFLGSATLGLLQKKICDEFVENDL